MVMAHVLTAVTGDIPDEVPIQRILVSVFDKTGIVEFCTWLQTTYPSIEILSTGGTAKALRNADLRVVDVSDYTGAPECFDGRIKTLHPKIHGGLLAVRNQPNHATEMITHNIGPIDMTIVNLYPFEETIAQTDVTYATAIENIDIGGPSMIRSTAKNHAFTTIVTSPTQYEQVKAVLQQTNGSTTYTLRQTLAAAAFAVTAKYDTMIATYFAQQVTDTTIVTRQYQSEFNLKYGCNPHQNPASILSITGNKLPFEVINGTPGYINLLDACNAWQLVVELKEANNGLAAAASFKHVSPAGAAVAVPLTDIECQVYEVSEALRASLSPSALAYLRARNADPMCSYGDFCAISDIVDEVTAKYLKIEVSDGIIAPGYTPEALKILQAKKGGKFIILQATEDYNPGNLEYREVYGMTFCQKRNDIRLTANHITNNVVTTTSTTGTTTVSDDTVRDLLVATICIKYTQSNSVGFSYRGMMIGVGAGQQSRVDCVKLAGRKVQTWYLRQHPKVVGLPFKTTVKRQERINARVRYIEGDFTTEEKERWDTLFVTIPEPLSEHEKQEFLHTCTGISISSDAFFPFRDSIDVASKYGVTNVVQPGGSVQDKEVIDACNTYNMTMAFTNIRLFHH